jgi:poly(3-hydroxybutyrate) depolymerase
MEGKFYIVLILASLMFVSCDIKDVDIVSGSLYFVSTTEGEGFVKFERKPNDQWGGIYYLSESRLMAKRRAVSLKVGKDLTFVDDTGKKIPVLSYSLYEEPEFIDYPETWTYQDSAYSVTVIKDVIYASALGYWASYPDTGGAYQDIFDAKQQELDNGKKELKLTMDVYLPNDSNRVSRPLLVLIHGGAFFNGDKADLGFPEWAHYFASMGYVVASVNYRLGFNKSLPSVKRAGFRAVQDVDAAIRYIVHNKNLYNVNPNRVFVAGTSAGGITALNVAFMRDWNIPSAAQELGGIKSVNPEIAVSYSILAVGNLWGAVNDLSILDNASSSVISFHSTGDPVVPFGEGHPFKKMVILNLLLFPTMYGSERITEYLGEKRSTLRSYDLPGKHTLHLDTDENGRRVLCSRFFEIEKEMRDYFSSVMQPSPIVASHTDNLPTFQISSSEVDSIYWHVEGGVIMKQGDCRADVLLFPDVSSHSVIVCGKYKSGLTFRHKWNL